MLMTSSLGLSKSLYFEFYADEHKRFQMSSMGELTFFLGLQVKQKDDGIFISQDKYVADILKKFDFATVKTASTPIETNKALLKDEEAEDVDVHLYRSMIGSLMYLTASRPDIMFVVYACARFQVTPKVSHLHAVKRIFRYLKGQPKLGLWYPRDSPFDLEAFSDSDYAGASLDRKSTTGGCQFLGKRLISWQCKKQTIVANSTTEAEYVAAANCCGQVLWIQNQMLDYGFNFMNTKIHIDNESTICIVKNPVFHAKTKHIEIRHHFIRDSYEKRLIEVIKIHSDHNVSDLLTKAFDVSSISNEFGVKTGGCKVNAARQDLFVDQHKMVAYLEKSEGNTAFHEIVDFLTASSVHHALTVSPTIDASYIEQFGNTAYSQTVNDVKQIHATILLRTFVNEYSTPAHTKKVFTNMKRKGKDLSGRVTPLFASMLAPPVVEGEGSGQPSEPQPTPSTAQPRIEEQIPVTESSSPQNTQSPRKALQEDTQCPQTSMPILNIADESVFKGWDGKVLRATTTAASLDVAQASGNISKTQSTTMSNDPLSQEIGLGDRPRVLALEQSKTAQDLVIRKLKKKGRKSDKIKPMFDDSDFAKIDVDNAMENVEVNTANIDVSAAGPSDVSTADPSTSTAEDIFKDEMMTIADTLVAIRSTRPRTTSVIIHDVEEEPRKSTLAPTTQPSSKDKGKALMVEPEKPSKNPRKAQIQMDEELAIRLHEEEKAKLERMQRERATQEKASNAALIAEFDNVQARMEADALLTAILQEKEREQFL
ncbi:putative ribonuclease H-like domain-containing protein [Tanacetum coccineum]|uniref:Ribonuclease H-like domain-containing protein n=1 Tax=Tanacetum coccineum TaxID=301880 RepID=A0ABQ5CN28_9ASTR